MKFIALFCLFVFCAFVSAQDNEVKYIIDPFTEASPTIVTLIPTGGLNDNEPDLIDSNHVQHPSIMGGERGLELVVTGGNGNLVLSTGVSGGQYSAATPNQARGRSTLQLDGVDGTMNLNPIGLVNDPNNNFFNGDAFALRVLMESDLFSRVVFTVTSPNGVCTFAQDLPANDLLQEYILPYSSFSTGCDFSNVGAIEITIGMEDNVDVIVRDFSTWGPVQTCVCVCPAFTCDLRFDFDDNNFSYYRTSQFGIFNPTTDFSTIYTSDTVILPSINPSNIPSAVTSLFSTSFSVPTFTDSFSFSTSFSTFSFSDDDGGDDDSSSSSSGSSSSSSDASVVTTSFALIAMIVVALF